MDKLIWVIVAFIAGAVLPIQAGLNNKIAKAGESPVHASAISFVVGLLALLCYILISAQDISWKGLKEAPLYAWTGGLLGAFYVTIIVFAFPKIGPGFTFGLVVAGQLLISMIMEHFQILGAQYQPISLGRVAGLLLIIGGVILMKR